MNLNAFIKPKRVNLNLSHDYRIIRVKDNKVLKTSDKLNYLLLVELQFCYEKKIDIKIVKDDKVYFVNSYIHNSSNALNMSAYYYQKKFKDKMYKLFSENMWNALHDKDFYKNYVFLDNGIILDRNTLQDHYTGEQYKGIYFHDYLLCYQKV